MTATHTPGPWAVNPAFAQVDAFDQVEPIPICQLLWPTDLRTEDETEANAALIAAAPDLLAHAEKSLRFLIAERDCQYDAATNQHGEYTDDEDRMAVEQMDREIDELRALIATARGEQP